MPYYCISAKTGENIDELFYKIAEMLEQQEIEKHKKLKQTYSEEYEHPPATIESLTRSETKESTIRVDDNKDNVVLTTGKDSKSRYCKC